MPRQALMPCTAPTVMEADPAGGAALSVWAQPARPAPRIACERPHGPLPAAPTAFGFTAEQLKVLRCQIMTYRRLKAR